MKLNEALKQAQNNKLAVLAANFYNYETCKGIILAAAELNLPVILQLTRSSIEYMGVKNAVSIGRIVSSEYNVKSWIHLDHCQEPELVKVCLDEGFDSVMIDASDKSYSENIKITSGVVKAAESYGVNVEAELGYVPKPDSDVEDDKFTIPAEAKEFVEKTGVTSLAVAIGSKHGFYKGEAKLDIKRLQEIHAITNVNLVLHGGSGIPAETLKEAVKNGICKVNVATETKDIFMRTLKEVMNKSDEIDLRKVFPLAVKEVKSLIETKLKIVSLAQ
jgi:fructose-bisphosphate aldolase class II/tagatose 1,6-diphosphate aldolase GatY/KbaY